MSEPVRSGNRGRIVRVAVGLAITVLFVWLIARKVDGRAMRDAFTHLDPAWVLLGVFALVCGYCVRIFRWYRMLVNLGAPVRYLDAARAFLSGTAINNVIPLRAGDAMRVIGLSREIGFPMARILSSLIVERLLDVCVLLLLLFVMLLWLPSGVMPGSILVSAEWMLGLVLLLEALILAGPRPAMALIERFVTPISPKVGGIVHHLAEAFSDLARPALVVELFGYSIVSWFLEGLLFVCFVMAAHGASPFAAGITTFTLGTLSTLIPSGPGFVGTFDMFSMLALQIFGMNASLAATIAVSIHAVLWVTTTAAGAAIIAFGGFSMRRQSKAENP